MDNRKLGSIIEAQQFDLETLMEIFRIADEMQEVDYNPILKGKILISFFIEPSTRTRFSTESAALRLGMENISSDNAGIFSSLFKGEPIKDAIKVMGRYGHIIALRSKNEGTAEQAARFSRIPVVNCGDGTGQHPTQALLDVYTMIQKFGKLEGLNIALVGDLLRGRTVRSLCQLIGKHFPSNKIFLVSPKMVRMRDDIKDFLTDHKVEWYESETIDEIIESLDIWYQTRVQWEREENETLLQLIKNEAKKLYITKEIIERMKKDAIVLHPMPCNEELPSEVDDNHRNWKIRQSDNGLAIRMALLKMILLGY